jgi:hypothetical protein
MASAPGLMSGQNCCFIYAGSIITSSLTVWTMSSSWRSPSGGVKRKRSLPSASAKSLESSSTQARPAKLRRASQRPSRKSGPCDCQIRSSRMRKLLLPAAERPKKISPPVLSDKQPLKHPGTLNHKKLDDHIRYWRRPKVVRTLHPRRARRQRQLRRKRNGEWRASDCPRGPCDDRANGLAKPRWQDLKKVFARSFSAELIHLLPAKQYRADTFYGTLTLYGPIASLHAVTQNSSVRQHLTHAQRAEN